MSGRKNRINELEHLLWSLNQTLNQATRICIAEKGLSMPRFWALRRLSIDKPSTTGELQRRLYLAPATITGLVDGLVDKGLVARCRDYDDRRVVLLKLTKAGKALVDEILEYRVNKLRVALGNLENVDVADLNAILDCLSGLLQQSLQEE